MKHRLIALMLVGLAGQVLAQQATYPVISEMRFWETSGLNDEFVELYNPTGAPVDVSGWLIQYKSETGTLWSTKLTIPAGTIIPSHKFWLYGGHQNTTTPDYSTTSTLGLGNNGGHVRLADAGLNTIDKIGWDAAIDPEGSPIPLPPARGGSYERKAFATSTEPGMAVGGVDYYMGNGWDSNNNASDYVSHAAGLTNAQNSSSPAEPVAGNLPPTVDAVVVAPTPPVNPGDGLTFTATATDTDGTVSLVVINYGLSAGNLDQAMILAPIGGNQYANGTPITAPGSCQNLYYQVVATDNLGDTGNSSVLAVGVTCNLTIEQIQGHAPASPYAGQLVTTEGQVTFLHTTSSMFIQEANGAWHGIQIYGNHPGVAEGDWVRVTGTVLEYNGFTEITNPGLSIQVLSSPGPLTLVPELLTVAQVNQEDYESVLVRVEDTYCTDALNFIVFDGTDQIKIYFPAFTPVEDDCYDIQGVRYSYFGTLEILPRTIDEIQTCGVVDAGGHAGAFSLGQAWPNPFNPSTLISFTMDRTAAARLSVFNILGQEVAVLADGVLATGPHAVRFDAAALPSGLYLYTLQSEGRRLSGRMLLIR